MASRGIGGRNDFRPGGILKFLTSTNGLYGWEARELHIDADRLRWLQRLDRLGVCCRGRFVAPRA
jgi:hypothetical protein